MANHSYFCLGGHNSPNGILDHQLLLESDQYTFNNDESIPTKEVISLDDHTFMKHIGGNLKDALVNLGKSQNYSDEEIA
jgi:galactose mutarotase-like enzyme